MRSPSLQRLGVSALVLAVTAILQGCLAAAWVAAVGVGSSRSGSVEFEPFENSWVAPAEARRVWEPMNSVAIPPFVGDDAMARRFSVTFQDLTTLTIVGPEQLARDHAVNARRPGASPATELDQPRVAQAIASRAEVDGVLFGTVMKGEMHLDAWGNKEVSSNRLLITLIDAHGRTLWKDELPYRVIEGAQPFPEKWFQDSLTTHVAAHARAIGLPRLGLPPGERQVPLHTRLHPG